LDVEIPEIHLALQLTISYSYSIKKYINGIEDLVPSFISRNFVSSCSSHVSLSFRSPKTWESWRMS